MLYFLVFLFGASVGSFLNSLIYRLPERKKIFLDRSICPKCFHQLSFLDLIPIFSFLFLAGRCRYCRKKISWQYPLVELITGLLFLFSFVKLSSQFSIILLRDFIFISVMIFVFVYDLKYMLIEDVVVIPSIIIIFFLNFLILKSLAPIFLGGTISLSFFLVQYILTKKEGLGEGDLRLGFLIGIMFGWPKVLLTIFTSYFIGAIIALILLIIKKKKLYSKVPLGPFLAIGSLITLFFGEKIINFYL